MKPMRHKLLGPSGIRVSEMCLGAMTFGNVRGWGASKEESRAVFNAFVDAGGNFIDTANIYQSGESETLLGEFVAKDRDQFVLATKFSLAMPDETDPNLRGNSRKSLRRSVEASLRRLGTDHIDLLWVHAWDGHSAEQELLRSLDDMVAQGKILAIGLSNTPAWVCSRNQTLAQDHALTLVSAIQLSYSLIERSAEREMLPMAEDFGISITAFGGLGSGILTGKYRENEQADGRLKLPGMAGSRFSDRNEAIVDAVVGLAREKGALPSQIALAWLRQRSPTIIPLVGARTREQILANLGYLTLQLEEDDMRILDEVSQIDQGMPRQLLLSPELDNLLHGVPNILDAPSRV